MFVQNRPKAKAKDSIKNLLASADSNCCDFSINSPGNVLDKETFSGILKYSCLCYIRKLNCN